MALVLNTGMPGSNYFEASPENSDESANDHSSQWNPDPSGHISMEELREQLGV